MPPTVIQINKLEYSGGLTEDAMKLKIVKYFNTLNSQTFDRSDIIAVLYDNGASYVNTNMAIYIREYDSEAVKTTIQLVDQRYTIRVDVVSRFFTSMDDLIGVSQV